MARPREWNREELAAQLLEWVKKEDSLNLNGFCASVMITPQKITLFANENPTFREAYELTKSMLADKREKMLTKGKLHPKAYDLNITVYDYFAKQEKREQAEYDRQKAAQYSEQDLNALEKLMKQCSDMQASGKDKVSNSDTELQRDYQ